MKTYELENKKETHGKKSRAMVFALFFLALTQFVPAPVITREAWAQVGGDLQIVPTRVVFEGRDRSAEVNLMNQGAAAETYRISFKNFRVNENGDYEEIEKPGEGERFAAPYIRYSPRQVTLQPGEAQTVRLLLRKKKDMEPGEYRSHLYIRTVPPENLGETLEQAAGEEDQIKIQLIPIFGVTIPVIARHGKGSVQIGIGDVQVENQEGKRMLNLNLNREGEFSAFGDLEVTLGAGGSDEVVGALKNVAVHVPAKNRTVRLELNGDSEVSGKTLHLVYREVPEKGGKIIAETDAQIP